MENNKLMDLLHSKETLNSSMLRCEESLNIKKISYIRTDDNKIINEKCIKWVKKIDDCLDVCTKSDGCSIYNGDTHKICKINNLTSYNKLNIHFS